MPRDEGGVRLEYTHCTVSSLFSYHGFFYMITLDCKNLTIIRKQNVKFGEFLIIGIAIKY